MFFGRERETGVVAANLRTRKLTLLYGPTGVGKSSLLGAGVLNHLKSLNQEAAPPDIARVAVPAASERSNLAGDFGDADDYDTPVVGLIFTDWTDDPLRSLQQAILTALQQSLPKVFTDQKTQELHGLQLAKMIEEISAIREVELLIILDQFERYFVYHPVDDEESSAFDDEFCRAVSSRKVHANFLISIREDWLARLDRFKGRINNLFENAIRVSHLNRAQAEAAIKKPIEKYNALLKEHRGKPGFDRPQVKIEDTFVPELLNQLQSLDETNRLPAGASFASKQLKEKQRRIQASNLQIVLRNLWEKIKDDPVPTLAFDLVRDPQTAKRIIQSNLQRTLEQLSSKEKSLAAELFRFMVTTSGAKLAETADGLAKQSGCSPKKTATLLNKLCDRKFRILSEVQPPPDQPRHNLRYELTSDTLANPIREWVTEVRAERRRRKTQLNYWLAIVVLIIAFGVIILIASLVKSTHQQAVAKEQARLLEREKEKADRALAAVRKLDDQVPHSAAVLRGHGDRINTAVFASNGDVLTASSDGSAMLWDIETQQPKQVFRRNGKALISATINPRGDRVLTASVDGSLIEWEVGSDRFVQLRLPSENHITDVSYSKDSDLIAAATTVGSLVVWDAASLKTIKEIPGNGSPVRQLTFSPSGKLLATASEDFIVRVWRTADWSQTNVLAGHTGIVCSVAFRPDEKFIATAGADTTVRVWDLATNQATRILMGHAGTINSVDFSNDGQRLLTASDDTTARIWIIDTSKSTILIGHTDRVISSSFSPTSQQVVTASKDGVVRIWSAITGQSMIEFRGHIGQVNYVSYSSDGKYVLSAGVDATARVWYATDSGSFRINQPTIVASPPYWNGPCPVTISFLARVIALSGSGKVTYKFIASDGRAWFRELAFDGPNSQDINWYWRIEKSYHGSQTIEVLEPKGTKPETASFSVKCTSGGTATPVEPVPPGATSASPSVTPAASPSPNHAPR